jgi:hypothetical protein
VILFIPPSWITWNHKHWQSSHFHSIGATASLQKITSTEHRRAQTLCKTRLCSTESAKVHRQNVFKRCLPWLHEAPDASSECTRNTNQNAIRIFSKPLGTLCIQPSCEHVSCHAYLSAIFLMHVTLLLLSHLCWPASPYFTAGHVPLKSSMSF